MFLFYFLIHAEKFYIHVLCISYRYLNCKYIFVQLNCHFECDRFAVAYSVIIAYIIVKSIYILVSLNFHL